ncbi:phosphate ABC transporter permease subunit PstC [Thermoflavifilum thermophilum]|uniref:Phosphate transport system permease protein n=1 Tax=Thermoflavifilum thermophilum TaxID=1393122 RepID=A0A1I7N0F1_9BACT|nr:phosphate ABC transporter permease subunit PstC [Thermoflavifilum thermophilum]SFV28133.1 phosphate transport system permease protein [Thermoflavifilum thermophilum]
MNREKWIEILSEKWMLLATLLMCMLPLSMGIGLLIESMPLLQQYRLGSLIRNSAWSPAEGKFGMISFIVGTLWVTGLSLCMAAPVSLLVSIYVTQYAKPWLMRTIHIVMDILAGIPSVVYGVWGVLVIVPWISQKLAPTFGYSSSGYCILSGGLVLAVMSIPYILHLQIEIFRTIPIELKEVSLSLGATYWETIKHVLLRQARRGIIASVGLGISKALGETIAVLMVVGNVPQIPENIFQAGYPLPALIANNYGEMMSVPHYLSALMFASLILFLIICLFNSVSHWIIYKINRI